MNIVIKAGSASLTQFSSNLSYSLEDIKVYSDKGINSVKLIADDLPYPCNIEEITSVFENFTLYTLNATIAENDYIISFTMSDGTIVSLSIAIHLRQAFSHSDLQDEHTALLVIDRTIQVIPNQVTLVAEDHLSQQIRFKIRRRYDNINFIDDKVIAVEYIPAQWEQFKKDYSDLIDPAIEFLVDGNITFSEFNDEYVFLHWNVPLTATLYPGSLSIALSITSSINNSYVWQTVPATLTVAQNIGHRGRAAIPEISTITTELGRLQAEITNIEERTSVIEEQAATLENIFNGGAVITLEDGGNEE